MYKKRCNMKHVKVKIVNIQFGKKYKVAEEARKKMTVKRVREKIKKRLKKRNWKRQKIGSYHKE